MLIHLLLSNIETLELPGFLRFGMCFSASGRELAVHLFILPNITLLDSPYIL